MNRDARGILHIVDTYKRKCSAFNNDKMILSLLAATFPLIPSLIILRGHRKFPAEINRRMSRGLTVRSSADLRRVAVVENENKNSPAPR